ncbi:MAG: PKD domain-containing protein [Fimbriimonadales bacterium]
MKSHWWMTLGLAVGLISTGLADATLYQGQPAEQAGLTLRNWGAGTIEDSTETTFVGSRSLKVMTRGMFSGGWVEFQNPVDLRADLGATDKVMRFALRFPGTVTGGGGAMGGGPRGGAGDFGEMGSGPRGGPQSGGGLSGPGAPGAPGGGGGQQTSAPTMSEVRIILQTTDGKKTEFMLPLQNIRPDDAGWQSVSIPLAGIPGLRETNGQIRRIAIAGDSIGVFYVGEIRVLSEQTPIQGYMVVQNAFGGTFTSRSDARIVIAGNDELTFIGVSEAGNQPVVFRWSFEDPNQVDGEGQVVRRRFPRRGTYTVYLTIADPFGKRAPTTTKMEIQVN